MERDLWSVVTRAIKRLAPTRPPGAVYWDSEVLALALWAALHDRSISWACQRCNWPPQAWRRRLPDQSTMSRRLRRREIVKQLRQLLDLIQHRSESSGILLVDGKALEVSEYSMDPDALVGRGVARFSKGYKLHALIDDRRRILAWRVYPLNKAECVVAQQLLRDASERIQRGALLLADAAYDSNRLHLRASVLGIQLVAPRQRPFRSVARRQHPSRLRSIQLTEGRGAKNRRDWFSKVRATIERFFGTLASVGGGMSHLPGWARRLHRCDIWVGAKLVIHAARCARA